MAPEVETERDGRSGLAVRVGVGLFAPDDDLGALLSVARRVDVETGQVLHTSGQPVATLFQVLSGQVDVQAPDLPTWRVDGRGAVGLIDFALGRLHSRTALATAPSQLLELDATEYRDYLEDNYETTARILSELSSQLIADVIATTDPTRFIATDVASHLPSFSEVEVPIMDRLIIVSRMPAFRGASVQALAELAHATTERRFCAGEVIAAAGERSDVISLLVEGTVELELVNCRARRTGRDFVASVEELATGPRRTTVTAATDTIVLQLARDSLLDQIEQHFDLALTLLRFVVTEQERVNDASPTGRCRVT